MEWCNIGVCPAGRGEGGCPGVTRKVSRGLTALWQPSPSAADSDTLHVPFRGDCPQGALIRLGPPSMFFLGMHQYKTLCCRAMLVDFRSLEQGHLCSLMMRWLNENARKEKGGRGIFSRAFYIHFRSAPPGTGSFYVEPIKNQHWRKIWFSHRLVSQTSDLNTVDTAHPDMPHVSTS